MCFGSRNNNTPNVPSAPAPPPVVDDTAAEEQAKMNAARAANAKKFKLAQGQNSTILTSPEGDTTQANTQKKTILGA